MKQQLLQRSGSRRRDWLRAIVPMALTAGGLPLWASAQESWPGARPVRLVLPFAPGGIPTVIGTLVVQGLKDRLGGAFITENKPGASATLGTRQVALAPPDGHTLLFTGTTVLSLTPFVVGDVGYDPLTSFTHLGMTGNAVMIYVANPRWTRLDEVFAAARRRPGELTYASWGIGSPAHVHTHDLLSRAGVEMTHVPYQGTAPALTDVAGGRIDIFLSTFPAAIPLVEAGKVRALGMATAERWRSIPAVPTVAEQGFPGYALSNWTGVSAPAGLPADIAERIEAALTAMFSDPAVLARLEPLGISATPTGARAMREQLARDVATNRNIVARAGILQR